MNASRLGLLLIGILCWAGGVRAETVAAPGGGQPIALGADRVVCKGAPPEGGWTIEPDGHGVRPPARDAAVGQPVTVHVAASDAACATASTPLTLVVVGPRPAAETLLFDVDAGRVVIRGKRMKGAVLRWSTDTRSGADVCTVADKVQDSESCAFSVPRDLPADPSLLTFALLPPGSGTSADVAIYEPSGRRISSDALSVRPTEIDLARWLPDDVSVDVSQGMGRIPLPHPEAVGSVTCVDATCAVDGKDLTVRSERGSDDKLEVHVQLRPHVFLRGVSGTDAAPVATIPLQRCPVSVASAAVVGGSDETRVVVRIEGSCATAGDDLLVSSAEGQGKVERTEVVGGALYAIARVPRIDATSEMLTVRRRGTILGATHANVQRLVWRSRIELEDGTALDFIPTNRWARIRMPAAPHGAAFELRGVDGVYDVKRDAAGIDWIRGTEGATGSTSIRLALVDKALPGTLAGITLAEASEPVEHAIHVANVPLSLGVAVRAKEPIAELTCNDANGHAQRLEPGVTSNVPYRSRDSCQLVLHRERLHIEDGAQPLQVSIGVASSDGASRPEARIEQRLVLKPNDKPTYVALGGATDPFDRITVRLSASGEGGDDLPRAAQAQWSVVTGTDHARLYGTTAIPTGLFRVADKGHSGILTLSVGALMRLVALSRDGTAFPLGMEAGVMWLGVAGDSDPSVASHGAVAIVVGPGIAVPIANPSRASQTSINLHAWLEYEVSREVLGQAGNSFGFVFGPSISIGDVGTNF